MTIREIHRQEDIAAWLRFSRPQRRRWWRRAFRRTR